MKKIINIVLLTLVLITAIFGFGNAYDRIQNERSNEIINVVADYSSFKTYFDKTKEDFFEGLENYDGISTILFHEYTIRDYEAMGDMAIYYYYEIENMSVVAGTKIFASDDINPKSLVLIPKDKVFYDFINTKLENRFEKNLKYIEFGDNDCIVLDTELDERTGVLVGFDNELIEESISNGYSVALSFGNAYYGSYDFLDEHADLMINYDIDYIEFGQYEFPGYPDMTGEAFEMFSGSKSVLMLDADYGVVTTDEVLGLGEYLKYSDYYAQRTFNLNDYTSITSLTVNDLYLKMLRAAIDRGNRIFIVRPISNSKNLYTQNLEDTKEVFSKFYNRLKDEYEFSSDMYNIEFDSENIMKTASSSLSVILLAAFLIFNVFKRKKFKVAMILLVFLGFGLFYVGANSYVSRLNALMATLVFPSTFVFALFQILNLNISKIVRYLLVMLSFFGCGILNILVSVSSLSNVQNFFGMDTFIGVKFSFVVPLMFFVYMFVLKEQEIKKLVAKFIKFLNVPITYLAMSIIAILLVGAYIYLARSGNLSTGLISGIEVKVREYFEDALLARPRFKEFLVGYPSICVLTYLYTKYKSKLALALFGLLSAIGMVSFVNTYSHVNAYLEISIKRSIYGVLFGLAISLIAIIFVFIVEIFIKRFWKGQKDA